NPCPRIFAQPCASVFRSTPASAASKPAGGSDAGVFDNREALCGYSLPGFVLLHVAGLRVQIGQSIHGSSIAWDRVPHSWGTLFMLWFFGFFFISGFCSLLYEIVWLRLAMAQFGVTSALVSIVLSTFMAGLGLGSWASGRLIRRHENKIVFPALRIYALTELAIGASAIVVPHEL